MMGIVWVTGLSDTGVAAWGHAAYSRIAGRASPRGAIANFCNQALVSFGTGKG